MTIFRAGLLFTLLPFSVNSILAQTTEELLTAGEELYFQQVSCWVCHGEDAEGRIGPNIQYGPTPAQMQEQLDSNPQMAIIVSELNPDADDLVALSVYLRSLSGASTSAADIATWRSDLAAYIEATEDNTEYVITERDRKILEIQSFDTVLSDWQKRSLDGSLKREYQAQVVVTYDAGEQVFFPEPGGLYFYELSLIHI